jgi:sigma-B regulation protein RsbU (phosphoserine phosphatase)
VLLLDMNYARDTTSGGEGLDLLRGLRASGIDAPVVVMTAWGSVELAVEAMRRGASDFVQKPWDNTQLLDVICRFGMQGRQSRSDIDIARSVQQNLQGRADKHVSSLDYAGQCLPIGHVGGDYFDFLDIGPETLGVALADVSGKGMSAALLMAHLQAALRSHCSLAGDPESLTARLNRIFWESSPCEQYATLFYGAYDGASRKLRYVNAGHSAPVVLRASGTVDILDSTGLPVGMFPSWHGAVQDVRLSAGDTVAIFSDGVPEAGQAASGDFGEAGVVNCLRRYRRSPAMEVVRKILSEADRCGATDDMTAVVLHVM